MSEVARRLAPIEARLDIVLKSRLAVHTGRPGVVVDDTVARDPASGAPVIPSTALKGAARDVLRDAEHPFTDEEIATTFGETGDQPGAARFVTARPADGLEPVVAVVSNVALTEGRTPRVGHLRTVEAVEPLARPTGGDGDLTPLVLTSRLCVDAVLAARLDGQGDPRAAARRVLAVALSALAGITVLGSRATRGFGHVAVAIDPAQRIAEAWSVEAVLKERLPELAQSGGSSS